MCYSEKCNSSFCLIYLELFSLAEQEYAKTLTTRCLKYKLLTIHFLSTEKEFHKLGQYCNHAVVLNILELNSWNNGMIILLNYFAFLIQFCETMFILLEFRFGNNEFQKMHLQLLSANLLRCHCKVKLTMHYGIQCRVLCCILHISINVI